jgi:hypothetical protein
MALGLERGRIGQIDLPAVAQGTPVGWTEAYKPVPPGTDHRWVNYYTLDIGYSFIVEIGRLLFPALPDNHLRALALQLVADGALVVVVFFVFSQWKAWLGLVAAGLYAVNVTFYELSSRAFYYFWDVPLTFVVLGSLLIACRRQAETRRWLTVAAVALGFGVWLRGSWWPLSLFLVTVAASSRLLRSQLLIPALTFAVIAAPQVVRSSLARGRLAFTTRSVWHVAMVGLGYYPNPYGLAVKDEVIFNLTKNKYGVQFREEDYELHDQAARTEFLSIWQTDRRFVVDSFLGRLKDSIAGVTEGSQPSFQFVANPTYRLWCLAGMVAMILRRGEKRLLAVASGGLWLIYVLLTSAFFYVELDYDNVPQVALFFLFLGGIEAVGHAIGRATAQHDDAAWGGV